MRNVAMKNVGLDSLPVDVHCHGVGRFDFTDLPLDALKTIEEILSFKKHRSILTLYLPQHNFNAFLTFMRQFAKDKAKGMYPHIVGIALEGPLLASAGGTPKQGVWIPTKAEWQKFAECGKLGLIYCIFSPDADVADSESCNDINKYPDDVAWIAQTLLDGGVLPAAGHFKRADPLASATALQTIYNVVAKSGYVTITDHLYNDMPHNFKHAWRTECERVNRELDLENMALDTWTLENIDEKLGDVPATMIRNAKKGLVKIAMNVDGEHVDLAIVKKTIELVGAENFVLMTDSIQSHLLAGRKLTLKSDSTLLYQDEGIVAAGTTEVEKQIDNLRSLNLTQSEIDKITVDNCNFVLQKRSEMLHDEIQAVCI